MTSQESTKKGIFFILAFIGIGAFLEVYLGHIFQKWDPYLVLLASFLYTSLCYLALVLWKRSLSFSKLKNHRRDLIFINIATLLSWAGFFVSLKYIEPAVGSMVCFAIGPVISVVVQRFLRSGRPILKEELIASWAVFFGILILAFATLRGESGIGAIAFSDAIWGLGLSVLSALGMTVMVYYGKRFYEDGFDVPSVIVIRVPLLILFAFVMTDFKSPVAQDLSFWGEMGLLSFFTMVIPLYFIQRGVSLCEPITVALVGATQPIFTFLFQAFDSRIRFSFFTLVGILICLAFTVWSGRKRMNYQEPAPV